MKVVFGLRTPGKHRPVWSGELGSVPRVDELVTLPGEDTSRYVHSVNYDVAANEAYVLLKDD